MVKEVFVICGMFRNEKGGVSSLMMSIEATSEKEVLGKYISYVLNKYEGYILLSEPSVMSVKRAVDTAIK